MRDPDDIRNRTGTFQIVEGTVITASVTRGRAFINFGADYRTDFTVTIEPDDMRIFRQAKFDVRTLAGKRIRVRGWIEFYNGPEITITTPAAIESARVAGRARFATSESANSPELPPGCRIIHARSK